ncbi:hypothetical protein VC83_02179 [Pseudogymnoascus destructans]|uniref:Uncharacterized protein n=1 Tax=Pseudogymnoascus destructans TaxID=655981 RepID=A0A177AIC6_9PEZI|nr:uncharacterized protein VC83_02179 [Pseudogymnoascus destructans]OAF61550.1 hypothetical protein VC83_02179 [Pseudogymnoascus destructans]
MAEIWADQPFKLIPTMVMRDVKVNPTHHHECEEEILFPGFERESGVEGMMAANVVQHHEFAPSLDIWGSSTGFAPELTLHLAYEIPTLPSLDKYDGKKMHTVYMEFQNDELYPLVVGSLDGGLKGGEKSPPVPQFVIYLVAFWLSRKYRSVWRFNPCDFFGKKRPLFFGPTVEDQ